MAFDFSTLNPFAAKPTPAVQQAAQPQQNAQPKPNTDSATLPNNANTDTTPVDPLAPFAKMYDTATATDAPPQFALDDKALSTAASSLNIMQGVDPAIMQRARTGDSEAIMQLIEHAGRTAYQTALSHSSVLTNKFTDAREAYNSKDFGGKVRSELTVNALTNTPNFSHPVVRKELIKVAQDIQKQHPDASPQEVADRAKEYITELSRAVNPTQQTKPNQPDSSQTNWDDFFGSGGN